jgi:hypothetical protein
VACCFFLFSSSSAHFLVYYDTSQRIALPLENCFSALLPLEKCSSALLPLENYFSAALPLEKIRAAPPAFRGECTRQLATRYIHQSLHYLANSADAGFAKGLLR